MDRRRNPKAKCGNCPLVWRGTEKILTANWDVIEVDVRRCTKDEKAVSDDYYCENHPEFWTDTAVGFRQVEG